MGARRNFSLPDPRNSGQRRGPKRYRPTFEQLEDRTAPALLASQVPLFVPVLTGGKFDPNTAQTATSPGNVDLLLQRAAAATAGDNAIVAVVDRAGNILGVRVEGNVSSAITGDPNLLDFSIDGAVSLARTAAFFSSDADPLTSRTVQFISQSTITEREVNSYTYFSDPASTVGGPGFVAPIGVGGHFPPNVPFTPQVDLFGIENTNRDMLVNSTTGVLFTPGGGGSAATDVGLTGRFNIDQAYVPAGQNLVAPLSYYDTILSPGMQNDAKIPHVATPREAT